MRHRQVLVRHLVALRSACSACSCISCACTVPPLGSMCAVLNTHHASSSTASCSHHACICMPRAHPQPTICSEQTRKRNRKCSLRTPACAARQRQRACAAPGTFSRMSISAPQCAVTETKPISCRQCAAHKQVLASTLRSRVLLRSSHVTGVEPLKLNAGVL